MGKKSTHAEVDRRVHIVVKLLSSAKTNSYICQYAAHEWGASDRQTHRYIAKAREIIRADYSVDRHDFLGSRLALLDTIVQEAMKSQQHSNAIGALRLQAQLTRLLEGS